ncbi:LysR family transcriptional regulator [Roseateles saccharophilus]|uniref:DNA-binding transcriptional LysR family regulator n=1 Tax=Roseateles saccharophilus TaxID=304 RepID=A0A4V2VRJ9_ROSSA|nr:LysR family transcriptional regulator [Roseateles saccharophilus]MDG0831437.1 LysR family transcriptional regulator [Roseateles saccharophilus]TCU98679.1 DNA-binding transcriptional LysR family regulator [Roseateles saccharophilus]
MDIQHRHIEVFRAVMTAGSVTGAAALLHTSQPTLSRDLARLEQLLGYALFERERGRLKATARARALFDEVERSFQGLARVIERAKGLGRAEDTELSVLSLPALSHALLPGALAALLAEHPAARVSITPAEPPLLDAWMGEQRFDLGLAEQATPLPGVRVEPVLEADEVAVLPAGHALASREQLALVDFAGQDFISLAADDPYRREIDTHFDTAGIPRRLRLQTHSAVAVCELVRAGLGLAIVNPLTAAACAGAGLAVRPLAVSIPYRVSALIPLHRPAQPLVGELLSRLRSSARPGAWRRNA